ncbi:stalk domain-containing protein [Paenibacillus sp. FSL W7-1332]|uniref:stalk domain-containing protein n=1 Tax=Paenibacillus sp. FSL W7-1332 TaxID=2921702 RepID=UPI0030D4F38A
MRSIPCRKLGILAIAAALVGSGLAGTGAIETVSAAPIAVKEGLKNSNGMPLGQSVTVAGGPDHVAGLSSSLAAEGLRQPGSVAWLPDGSVVVSDTENHVIRRIKDGQSTILAGASLSYKRDGGGLPIGGLLDGQGERAFFNRPSGIAVDGNGQLYIADSGNHAIRKIDQNGEVTTIAGSGLMGLKDGKSKDALFHEPQDIAVTKDGILYVADTLNHVIRRISPDGEVTTIGAPSTRAVQIRAGVVALAGDYKNGSLTEARFNEPAGLALDGKDNLYVSDSGNHVIRYIDFGKGTVSTAAGSGPSSGYYDKDALYGNPGYQDGDSNGARFNSPRGLTWSADDGLLIADSRNHAVRQLKGEQVTTLTGGIGGYVDGIESETRFHSPADISVAAGDGALFIADQRNGAVRVWSGYKAPEAWQAGKGITAAYGDQVTELGDLSVIQQGQMMVPVKTIGKLLGYRMSYHAKNKELTLARGEDVITLQAGGQYMTRKQAGEEVTRAEAGIKPYIANDQMMAPLRTVAELLGKDVQWNAGDKLVIIRDLAEREIKQGDVSFSTSNVTPRRMQIVEITGSAKIRYGGYAQVDAYKGMILGEGDEIVTGSGIGGARLRLLDTDDVITLGNNTRLAAEQLRKVGISNVTRLNLEAGQAYYDVTDLTRSTDRFEVRSGYMTNSVRGTHFIITVNPLTGVTTVATASGKVTSTVTPTGKDGSMQPSGPITISPTQQISIGGSQEGRSPVQFIDIEDLIGNASPEVIAQLIKNKNDIDRENEELLKKMRQELQSGQSGNVAQDLSVKSPDDLSKVADNLDNLIGNIVKETLDKKKVSKEELDKRIKEANTDSGKKLDLGQVKELDKTAGLDPALEQVRLEALKRQQDEERKKLEQQQDRMEQLQQHLGDMLAKLEQQKKQQDEANRKAQEEMKKKAEEQLLQSLSAEEKERFLQGKKEAEQEKGARQPTPVSPGGGTGSGGSISPPVASPPVTGPPVTEPPVTEPPVTEPPKPEPPLPDRSVKVIYSDDMSGELSARPDNYFGSIHFETKGFADDLEVQVRVTLTRDGSPVVGLPVRHGEQTVESNAEGSFMLQSVEGTGFKLSEVASPDTPLEFYAELLDSGSYTEKIELLEVKEGQLTVLGESVRSIQVSPFSQFEFIGEGPFPAAIDMYWGFYSKAYGLSEDTKIGYELTILDDNGQPVNLGVLGFRMKPHESVTTLTEPGYEIVAPDSEGVYRVNAGLTAGDMDLEGNGSDILFRWQQAHVGTYTLRIQLVDVSGDVPQSIGDPLEWIIEVIPTS